MTLLDCPLSGTGAQARVKDLGSEKAVAAGDRIEDAIRQAGGAVADADLAAINLEDTAGALEKKITADLGSVAKMKEDFIQAGVTQLDSSIGGLGGCPFAPGASVVVRDWDEVARPVRGQTAKKKRPATRAMPTPMAAIAIRPPSSTCIVLTNPMLSSPSRLAPGTATLSNTSSAVLEA